MRVIQITDSNGLTISIVDEHEEDPEGLALLFVDAMRGLGYVDTTINHALSRAIQENEMNVDDIPF